MGPALTNKIFVTLCNFCPTADRDGVPQRKLGCGRERGARAMFTDKTHLRHYQGILVFHTR